MSHHNQNHVCRWSLTTVLIVTGLVIWTSVERFQDPVQEKYVFLMPPGNADFFFPFSGARALVQGANPYLNDLPGLNDPWQRGVEFVDGKEYRGLYPPAYFILYVPLALLTEDWRQAGRILFIVNLAALFMLAVVSWWLIVRILHLTGQARRWSVLMIPLGFVILACNVASGYALERGDGGDILAALLCWTALALFLKEWHLLAMFLMVPAIFIKGYAVLCGIGIGLLSLSRGTWRRAAAGAAAGMAVFVLPVIQYLPDALNWLRHNQPIAGWSLWWNHGFRNLFYHLSPALAEPGRWIAGGYCMVLAVACWLRAYDARRHDDAAESALWSTLFVSSSIETMLGIAPYSYIYNLLLILPGMLIFFIVSPFLVRSQGCPEWMVHTVGTLNVLSAFFVFKFVILDRGDFPSPGIGMILFLLSLGVVIAGMWPQRRADVASPAGAAA